MSPEMASISTSGHSAIVHITLNVGSKTLLVAQLGPDFLILKEADGFPPCDGTVTLEVDGHRDTFSVHLPAGIAHNDRRVVIEKAKA